jgi:ATP-dependent protease ClpP protease subunit
MEVNSPGGLIPQSLEIIRIMDSLTCTVNTLCRGAVGGTSVVIAAHGARGYRTAMANCRFSLTLDVAGLDSNAGQGDPQLQRVLDMLARDVPKGKDQVLSWVESGVEFNAQQALAAGLIDFISAAPIRTAPAPAPHPR